MVVHVGVLSLGQVLSRPFQIESPIQAFKVTYRSHIGYVLRNAMEWVETMPFSK